MTRRLSSTARQAVSAYAFSTEDMVWVMGSFCALNRKPFDPDLLVRQFPPPYGADSLIHAARALGFRVKRRECAADEIAGLHLPGLVVLREGVPGAKSKPLPQKIRPAIVIQANGGKSGLVCGRVPMPPKTLSLAEFADCFAGTAFSLASAASELKDPDGAAAVRQNFGVRLVHSGTSEAQTRVAPTC